MQFSHSARLRDEFPQLAVATIRVEGVTTAADFTEAITALHARATERLQSSAEGQLPEITAWRRAFSHMGLKPTQYRCASEALLRRFKKEGTLSPIHPIIDLCNAVSIAYAIPIAVFDLDQINGDLEVRRARGDEIYLTFGGEAEHPEPGEVIYADTAGNAHARRWTNRQSSLSAIREQTSHALIVSEALHATGGEDLKQLQAELTETFTQHHWPIQS